jgi:hypothetical protein
MRIQEMVKGKPGHDAVKAGIGERKASALAKPPVDVFQAAVGLEPARPVKHGRDQIKTGDVMNPGCEETGDDTGAAGCVEKDLPGAEGGTIGHQFKQILVALGVTVEKRFGLPGKLIDNLCLVLGGIHIAILDAVRRAAPSAGPRMIGPGAADLDGAPLTWFIDQKGRFTRRDLAAMPMMGTSFTPREDTRRRINGPPDLGAHRAVQPQNR